LNQKELQKPEKLEKPENENIFEKNCIQKRRKNLELALSVAGPKGRINIQKQLIKLQKTCNHIFILDSCELCGKLIAK